MTTPLCNCPDDIGWLAEGYWPLSEGCKATTERIFCIGGLPVVRPYPKFATAQEASSVFVSGPTRLSAAGPGAPTVFGFETNTPLTYTNTTCHNMGFMMHTAFDMTIAMDASALYYFKPAVVVSGALTVTVEPTPLYYGSDIAGAGAGGRGAGFRQYSFVYAIPGTVPPGGSFSINHQLSYYTTSPGGTTPDVYTAAMVTRIWGGSM